MAKMMVFIAEQNKKLHVSTYIGHHQVFTTSLLKSVLYICLNRVVMLRSHHHLRGFIQTSLL